MNTLTAFVKTVPFPLNWLQHRGWWFGKEVYVPCQSIVSASVMTVSELEFVTFSTKRPLILVLKQPYYILSPCSWSRAGEQKGLLHQLAVQAHCFVWGNAQEFSVQSSFAGYQCKYWIIFIRLFELMEAFSSVFVDSLKPLFVYL